MKVDNLKDLQKLIQLCRKTGVEAIEVDGVKMNLGPAPFSQKQAKAVTKSAPYETFQVHTPGGIIEEIQIPTDGLTEEQLLMWSVGATDEKM